MDLSAVIFNTALYILDYIKMILLVTAVLNFKYVKSWKPLAAGGIFTLLYNIANINVDNVELTSWFYLFYHLSVIAVCALSLEGRKKILFSSAAFLVICILDDSMGLAVSKISNIPKTEFENDLSMHCIMMSITLVVYFIIARIFHEINKKSKSNIDIKNSESFYLLLLICGIFTLVVALNKQNRYLVPLSLFLIFLLCVTIYNSLSKKYLENTNHMNEKIMTAQKEYYEHLLDLESETRRFRHDINNHILCINALLSDNKYDAAKDYVQEMGESISSMRNRLATGNSLVNAIVNDISIKYNNVKLDWQGLIPEELTISNMDICTIFSNLLDNAFCAASKCSSGKVGVTVKTVANSLMVTIKNDISEPVKVKSSKFITSKKDKKNHGIGTMNVLECVKAHEGKVEYSYTDKDFTAEVILPNVIAV